jgi:hypothetical protein
VSQSTPTSSGLGEVAPALALVGVVSAEGLVAEGGTGTLASVIEELSAGGVDKFFGHAR